MEVSYGTERARLWPFMKPSAFQHRSGAAGLTEPLVRKVIFSFYDKVRHDPVLGPVFADAIGDSWDAHIERIMQFWLTATRLGRGYDGRNFMPAHLRNPLSDRRSCLAGSKSFVRQRPSIALPKQRPL
jgi:hemoglobin